MAMSLANVQAMECEELLSLKTNAWGSFMLHSPISSCTNSERLEDPEDVEEETGWGDGTASDGKKRVRQPVDAQDGDKTKQMDDMQFAASAVRKAEREDSWAVSTSATLDNVTNECQSRPSVKRKRAIDPKESTSSQSSSDHIIRFPAVPISIEEALEPCEMPRAVTLSSPPFIVVHVNAAYSRITGVQSNVILGRPFCATPKLKCSRASYVAWPAPGYDLRRSVTCQSISDSDGKIPKCKSPIPSTKKFRIKVSPVTTGGGCLCKKYIEEGGMPHTNCATHFAIDIVVDEGYNIRPTLNSSEDQISIVSEISRPGLVSSVSMNSI